MGHDQYFSPEGRPTATLGCGTLLLIGLVVAVFSGGGKFDDVRKAQREVERKLDRLERQGREQTREIAKLTAEIRELRETWTTDRPPG